MSQKTITVDSALLGSSLKQVADYVKLAGQFARDVADKHDKASQKEANDKKNIESGISQAVKSLIEYGRIDAKEASDAREALKSHASALELVAALSDPSTGVNSSPMGRSVPGEEKKGEDGNPYGQDQDAVFDSILFGNSR